MVINLRQKIKLLLEVISVWIFCIYIFLIQLYVFGFSIEMLFTVYIVGMIVTLAIIVSYIIFEKE